LFVLLVEVASTNPQPKPNAEPKKHCTAIDSARRRIKAVYPLSSNFKKLSAKQFFET
jgi:hypothetical protein